MHIGLEETWIEVECACWRSGLTHYTTISDGTDGEVVTCKDCLKAADKDPSIHRHFRRTAFIGDGTVRHAVRRKDA